MVISEPPFKINQQKKIKNLKLFPFEKDYSQAYCFPVKIRSFIHVSRQLSTQRKPGHKACRNRFHTFKELNYSF